MALPSSLMPCKMGLEGIVSKHKLSRYMSGRSLDWLKSKNSGERGSAAGGGGRLEQAAMAIAM
jgi:ATP-dependent DNA ligase